MDVEPAENQVLAQPTRARLFRLLTEIGSATSTGILAAKLGLHPNGIRLHLERLEEAGLVIGEKQRGNRGRPRDVWSINPSANPGGERPTAYADLGLWLAEALAGGPLQPEGVEASGRKIGIQIATEHVGKSDPRTRFHEMLAAMGFQPVPLPEDAKQVTYCLNNCPYRNVAKERPTIVCGLHRGITDGFLSSMTPTANLTDFQPKDPVRAGCLVSVRFDPVKPGD